MNTGGILPESIPFDAAIHNIFQQNAKSCRAPVLFEQIIAHMNIPGIHHGYAGSILAEAVVFVAVVIRKHKMQPVPQIIAAGIIYNITITGTFQVNAIAVPPYFIALNGDSPGAPHIMALPEVVSCFACP